MKENKKSMLVIVDSCVYVCKHIGGYKEFYTFWDLPEEEKSDFIDVFGKEQAEMEKYIKVDDFFYPLSDFTRIESEELQEKFDGIVSETTFSGIFIKINGDNKYQITSFYVGELDMLEEERKEIE